jgi:mono/diheme cytochrome c family protein
MRYLLISSLLVLIIACNAYKELPGTRMDTSWKVKKLPATPQQVDGDPEKGFQYISSGDYIGSGVPYDFFKKKMSTVPDTILNREGINANLNYTATVFAAPNGVKVVSGNCFTCHAGKINKEIIPGLGNSFSEYQGNLKRVSKIMKLGVRMKYKKSSPEWQAFEDFNHYFAATAPYIQTNQPGANPAFRLAEACMMHRNPDDLTYRKDPNYEMMDYTIATDTPPLWNVRKKNALYYNGIGRGDFTKLLFQASVLGIPDSTAARKAINNFRDVLAWLYTLEPPPYPQAIDPQEASKGKILFEEHCSKCHGTYGEHPTYPNKIISLALVKTDPMYANYAYESGIVKWYNSSWFAQSDPPSYFEPSLGYVAPPLDGIWATAPYLHNGSVPTIDDLLNSTQRPTRWKRSGRSDDYDYQKLGWHYEPAAEGVRGDWIFDATLPGYSEQGHYFGDHLSDDERKSVLEYLKTL